MKRWGYPPQFTPAHTPPNPEILTEYLPTQKLTFAFSSHFAPSPLVCYEDTLCSCCATCYFPPYIYMYVCAALTLSRRTRTNVNNNTKRFYITNRIKVGKINTFSLHFSYQVGNCSVFWWWKWEREVTKPPHIPSSSFTLLPLPLPYALLSII